MKDGIWQGAMFDALRHTLKQEWLRAVEYGENPQLPESRDYLAFDAAGVLRHYDDGGYSRESTDWRYAITPAHLCRQSPGYGLWALFDELATKPAGTAQEGDDE